MPAHFVDAARMSQESHEHRGLEERIAALEGQEAIRALKAKYAELADRAIATPSRENAEALADLFTDDGSADYGPFGKYQGREALLHAFGTVIPGAGVWSRHYMLNPSITVDGKNAKGNWYFLVYVVLRHAESKVPVPMFGTYEDTYTKTEKGWQFRSLVGHFIEPPK